MTPDERLVCLTKAMVYKDYTANPDPETPKGTDRIESSPDEVFLDLDFESQVRQFVDLLAFFETQYLVKRVRIWPSRSDGVHVVLTLDKKLSLGVRLAISSVLGSDPFRTLFTTVTRADFLFKPTKGFFHYMTEDPDNQLHLDLIYG